MNLPVNAVPLYRKLAYKSKIGFGKYADVTVESIFAIKQEQYLIWLYYQMSNISFVDEILDRLGIEKISKPGKSDELYKKYRQQRFIDKRSKMTKEEYMHYRWAQKCADKRIDLARLKQKERELHQTKGQLQQINHGHYK